MLLSKRAKIFEKIFNKSKILNTSNTVNQRKEHKNMD